MKASRNYSNTFNTGTVCWIICILCIKNTWTKIQFHIQDPSCGCAACCQQSWCVYAAFSRHNVLEQALRGAKRVAESSACRKGCIFWLPARECVPKEYSMLNNMYVHFCNTCWHTGIRIIHASSNSVSSKSSSASCAGQGELSRGENNWKNMVGTPRRHTNGLKKIIWTRWTVSTRAGRCPV